MTIEQELAQAQARIAEVEAERDTARTQAQTNFQNLQAMTAERDGLNDQLSLRDGEITNLKTQLAQSAQELSDYKAQEGPRFNALLQAELSKAGHPAPVAAIDNPNHTAPAKPDTSKLTGLAKVVAAFASQKNNQPK